MKKINRLLAFLLAFTVVITTFSSDYTAAHVYATEEEAVIDSENEIKTVEKEEIPVVSEASTEESTEASTEGSTEEAATTADTEENAGEGDENDAATTGIDGEVVNPEAVGEEETDADDDDKESLSQEVDGIRITLEADEGVLPEGAKLIVSKVSASVEEDIKELLDEETGDDVKVQDTFSFDINIYSESEGDPDNNYYVQPNGDVNVTFESIEAAEAEDVALSVYHVTDDIENATPVSDVVTGDETDITITTDHFSIYTVTITQNVYGHNKIGQFKIEQVDENKKPIGQSKSISITGGEASLDQIKSQLDPVPGCTFLGICAKKDATLSNSATYYEVSKFTIEYSNYYGDYYRYFYDKSGNKHFVANVNHIYAVYKKNNRTQTTSHHIDLGFLEETFNDYYLTGAKVSVKIGNERNFHEMHVDESVKKDFYEGQDYYEYRYSRDEAFDVDKTITFKVEIQGDPNSYYMECGPNERIKPVDALYRCINAHWGTQDEFGFDFISDFTTDFNYKATVEYHNGFAPDAVVATDYPEWTTHDETETTTTYTVRTAYPEGKAKKPYSEFDGWGMKDDATGKIVKITTPTITVSKTGKTEINAMWKDAVVPVAVYASDGTDGLGSNGLTRVVNPQLTKELGLNYIQQQDGYYPIGVVYLPSSMFANGVGGKYINSQAQLDAVIDYVKEHGIDTSFLTKGNKNNTVAKRTNLIQPDFNKGAGNHETALFDWNKDEVDSAISHPEEAKKFKYHLDLRFATSIATYIGEYYENDEKVVEDKKLTEQAFLNGVDITHPSMTPYLDGYTFDGFYEDKSCTRSFTATTISKNVNIYAKFTKVVKCYVTYKDGVDNEVVFADQGPTEVLKGAATPAFVTTNQDGKPSRVGYEFKGWYSSETQTTTMTVPAKVTATVTYTATWAEDYNGYVVEYYKQNVDNTQYTRVKTVEVKKEDKVKKTGEPASYDKSSDNILTEDEVKDGFAYVKTEANLTGDNFAVVTNDNDIKVRADGALVIRVYFKRNTYKVTYKYDDQEGKVKNINPAKAPEDKTEYRYGQTVTVDTTKPTATGYTFDGWYLDNDKKSSFIITADTELIGEFETKKDIAYTIKYFQQNVDDNGYTEVTADEQPKTTGEFGKNIDFSESDRQKDKYVGFDYAKTKVLLTGEKTVEYGKDAVIPDIPVPAETNTLVIEVYYDREVYEVTYSYVGTVPKIVDPTVEKLATFTKNYRFGQLVTVAADAKAPGYTFDGWKAYTDNSGSQLEQQVVSADEVETDEEGVAAAIKKFFEFVAKKITGEDGTETEVSTFEMPPSNVSIEGSFTKSPYKIVLNLKGNAEDEGFDYVTTYNGTPQSAPIDFTLEVYMEGSSEPLTALNVNSENYDTLMASIDKVMSLGTLTVYAASDDLVENLDPEETTYTGEEQSAKTVSKSESVTIDGRKYTVTLEVGCSEETDAGIYDITVKSISFMLGDKSVSDLFVTDIKAGDKIGTFTIQQAPLTHKADDEYKAYGASDPELTASIIGLVGKDAPNKDKVENFYKKYIYRIERDKGESAGGKYPIHVYLEGGVVTESPQQEVLPVEQLLLAEVQPKIYTVDDDIASVFKNYKHETADGILTIGPAGGGDDEEYVPRDPDADSPVAAAPAPAVLGAQRELPGEAPAVLGARRAGTSDTNILGSIITIIVAAAIAFSMVFIKRKKKEEN